PCLLLANISTANTIRDIKKNNNVELFIDAASKNKLNIVRHYIERNDININASTDFGITPLIGASHKGHTEIVQYLIEKGADINKSDIGKATPLHIAVRSGNIDVVKILLENDADINLQDLDGWTPLSRSVINNDLAIMDLLLEFNADEKITNKWDESPMILAVKLGYKEIVNRLLEIENDAENIELALETSIKYRSDAVSNLLNKRIDEDKAKEEAAIAALKNSQEAIISNNLPNLDPVTNKPLGDIPLLNDQATIFKEDMKKLNISPVIRNNEEDETKITSLISPTENDNQTQNSKPISLFDNNNKPKIAKAKETNKEKSKSEKAPKKLPNVNNAKLNVIPILKSKAPLREVEDYGLVDEDNLVTKLGEPETKIAQTTDKTDITDKADIINEATNKDRIIASTINTPTPSDQKLKNELKDSPVNRKIDLPSLNVPSDLLDINKIGSTIIVEPTDKKDIQKIPALPTLNNPTINVPSTNIPKITVPNINAPTAQKNLNPKITSPNLKTAPNSIKPNINIPPNITAPNKNIAIPNISNNSNKINDNQPSNLPRKNISSDNLANINKALLDHVEGRTKNKTPNNSNIVALPNIPRQNTNNNGNSINLQNAAKPKKQIDIEKELDLQDENVTIATYKPV
ncbi:MAG: ankyrin repeat domain-containing protein, partial [Pseudomonadota bacterium]